MAPFGPTFQAPKGRLFGCPEKENLKKLVAVDGGGQLLAVVHGQRLGCFAVEGVVKAGTPQGLCPGLPWVQQLYPCLERATGRGAGTPNKNGPKGPQLI